MHAPLWILSLLVAMAPADAAENAELSASIPLGETSLLDVGARQIFWQSYGKEPVAMPYLHSKKEIEPRLLSFKYLGGNKVEVTYQWVVDDTLDDDFHCFVHGLAARSSEPEHIAFQQDHPLPKPTSQWHKGDRIVDGPYTVELPNKLDGGMLVIGLHKGARVQLKGTQEGDNRIELARCTFVRKEGKIVDIRAEKIVPSASARDDMTVDFRARLNPPGTWIDFGKVATDGSVMIRREADRLVLYPYPAGRPFRVSLDVKSLAPAVDLAHLQVRALAAGTGRDLGPVAAEQQNGRLLLTVGMPGAGRYAIGWKSP